MDPRYGAILGTYAVLQSVKQPQIMASGSQEDAERRG